MLLFLFIAISASTYPPWALLFRFALSVSCVRSLVHFQYSCWLYVPETVKGEPASTLCSMCHCRSFWVNVLLMEFTPTSGLQTILPSHYHKPRHSHQLILFWEDNFSRFFLCLLDLAVPLMVYAACPHQFYEIISFSHFPIAWYKWPHRPLPKLGSGRWQQTIGTIKIFNQQRLCGESARSPQIVFTERLFKKTELLQDSKQWFSLYLVPGNGAEATTQNRMERVLGFRTRQSSVWTSAVKLGVWRLTSKCQQIRWREGWYERTLCLYLNTKSKKRRF